MARPTPPKRVLQIIAALRLLFAIAIFSTVGTSTQAADNGVTPGALVTERPTLKSLGFEWKINGDDNRNAAVAVTYRKTGASVWRQALPLFRMAASPAPSPSSAA